METILGSQALLRSHTVIYAGNIIGDSFQTGNKVNIRELNRIGDNVSVGTLSVIEHHVEIGNNVRIHSQAFIPEFSVPPSSDDMKKLFMATYPGGRARLCEANLLVFFGGLF